jgi:hypothetical protein
MDEGKVLGGPRAYALRRQLTMFRFTNHEGLNLPRDITLFDTNETMKPELISLVITRKLSNP